jgi:DNA-binding NtrC family response regulator
VKRAAAVTDGFVTPVQLGLGLPRRGHAADQLVEVPVGTSLDEARRMLVLATLRATGGDKVRSAEMLGISLKTLYNRLREYRWADPDEARQNAR